MSLVENKSLKENLTDISNELDKYKNISRSSLFTTCINNKLKNTLRQYNLEIELTSKYLIEQNTVRVMKTITKVQKENDLEALEQAIEKSKNDN